MNKGKLKYNIINIMDRSQAKQIVFVLWKQFCFINYGHHAYFRKYIYYFQALHQNAKTAITQLL